MGYFKLINCSEDSCGFHADSDHSIEECSEFKSFLQDLMDRHILQIWHQRKEKEVFAQIGKESNIPKPKPVVIHFTRESVAPVEVHLVVIQVPSPFPYKTDKAVPWKYWISVLNSSSCEKQENEATDIDKTTVDNISGIGGMTRSGRLFTPPELRNGKSLEKSGEEVTIEKAKAFLKREGLTS